MSEPSGDFVGDLTAWLAAEGFPRVPAAVLMALNASEADSMSSAELRDAIGVSAAAVSGAVRYLALVGFVRVITVAGSRTHRYALTAMPWYTSSLMRSDRWSSIAEAIEVHLADLGPVARGRLTETAEFFRFLRVRMPELLEEWTALRDAASRD